LNFQLTFEQLRLRNKCRELAADFATLPLAHARDPQRLLADLDTVLNRGHWRSICRVSFPPALSYVRFSTESRQHALGGFQIIELVAQLCPFGIELREPLRNSLPLLSDLVRRSHLLSLSHLPDTGDNVIAAVFSMARPFQP
jgi:hypothetical protein